MLVIVRFLELKASREVDAVVCLIRLGRVGCRGGQQLLLSSSHSPSCGSQQQADKVQHTQHDADPLHLL